MAKYIKPAATFDGWNIYNETYGFYCAKEGKTILFHAEYRKGLYWKIDGYYDGKRSYQATRYLTKLQGLVRDMAFELLKNGCLWDEINDCPALDSYKKDIEPYYRKCKEKGLSLYNDAEFLDSLFN